MALLALVLGTGMSRAAAGADDVVVTVAPLHSLVAGVMGETGQPFLLVRGSASPHGYALKPSEARALAQARLIFWIGPTLEHFAIKPIAALGAQARSLSALNFAGMTLMPMRGGAWDSGSEQNLVRPPTVASASVAIDPHIWLDPRNAKIIVDLVARELAAVKPLHADTYRRNAQTMAARLDELDRHMAMRLDPIKSVPFVVFHDAFQYLERRYGLNAVGSVSIDSEHQIGAKRLKAVRERIAVLGVRCLFVEPQFNSAVVEKIVANSGVRRALLDPEGALIEPGPDAYFRLMHGLADVLVTCLAGPG